MKTQSYAVTDVGKVRTGNEDYYLIRDETSKETLEYGKLYLVCDGMGGHQAGEVASKMAADEFAKFYYSPDLKNKENITERIKEAIQLTNSKVYEASLSNPALQGMGTTIVGLIIKGKKAYVFNIGDSKCFVIDKDNITQVTEDHSLVNELVKSKIITEEEAKVSSKRNILTRALGTDKDAKPFTAEFDIYGTETFILCTDGLSNMVKENEIKHFLSENDLKTALDKMVALANERGGPDNITVVGVKLEKEKYPKFMLGAAFALVAIIVAALFITLKPTRITIDTIPSGSTITVGDKSYYGKCSFEVKDGQPVDLKIHKDGYEDKELEIYMNQKKIYYRESGEEKEVVGSILTIPLKKLINIKVVDSSNPGNVINNAIVTVDGQKIDDLNSPIPLTIGKHKIFVTTSDNSYYEKTEQITVDETNENEIVISLEEVPLFTFATRPEGAKLYVFDETLNRFEQFTDFVNANQIDFNKIKGKKVIFIKDKDNFYVYFKEMDIGESPPSEEIVLDKIYTKIIITSDIENAKFFDYFNKELIRISKNTYLVPRKMPKWVNVNGISSYDGYKVTVKTTINILKSNKINFKFKIFKLGESTIEFLGSKNERFTGWINDPKHSITFDSNNSTYTSSDKIEEISGKLADFEYTFVREDRVP